MTATPINQTDVVAENNNQQLSIREKIGYGLGDAGGTVITCLIMNFLTFFYTDTFGLSAWYGESNACVTQRHYRT